MHYSDEELIQLQRDGARIVGRTPPAKAEPLPPSESAQILEAIRNLDTTLMSLADRPAPTIEIAAPSVVVKPEITVEARPQSKKWRVHSIIRDNSTERRMKEFTIEAVD